MLNTYRHKLRLGLYLVIIENNRKAGEKGLMKKNYCQQWNDV